MNDEPLSECCGMPAMGEIVDGWSMCSDCHEHAEFIEEEPAASCSVLKPEQDEPQIEEEVR